MIRSGDDGQHKYYKVKNHTYIDTYTHILIYIYIYTYIHSSSSSIHIHRRPCFLS